MNYIYKLSKYDVECNQEIAIFKNKNIAYEYIKKLKPNEKIYPIDKLNEKEKYTYGIKQILVQTEFPKTYLVLYINLDEYTNKLNTNYELITEQEFNEYKYKEQYKTTPISIYICKEIEIGNDINKYIKEQELKIKKEIENLYCFYKTNIGFLRPEEFWEKVDFITKDDSEIFKDKITKEEIIILEKAFYLTDGNNNPIKKILDIEF
jgi:hypothetical protein